MNNVNRQAVQNTYNIIYNLNVNDISNTSTTIQTSLRNIIEDEKLKNRLFELEHKIKEWSCNEKDEKDEKNIKETTEKEDPCPICYEDFKPTNYIVPNCGHKICLLCYRKCIRSGGDCINKCCMCKQPILP